MVEMERAAIALSMLALQGEREECYRVMREHPNSDYPSHQTAYTLKTEIDEKLASLRRQLLTIS